jgi:hypothetical protein
MPGTQQQKLRHPTTRRMMVTLALIFSAAACGEAAAGGYPRETIEGYLAACQGNEPLNADREAYCRCTIGALQKDVPFQRFADWERRTKAGEAIPELQEELKKINEECKR